MAALTTTVGAFVKSTWPIIVVAGTGLMGFATLRADVTQLKAAHSEQISDHDVLVRVDERQKTMSEDIKAMKSDIKDIATAVK